MTDPIEIHNHFKDNYKKADEHFSNCITNKMGEKIDLAIKMASEEFYKVESEIMNLGKIIDKAKGFIDKWYKNFSKYILTNTETDPSLAISDIDQLEHLGSEIKKIKERVDESLKGDNQSHYRLINNIFYEAEDIIKIARNYIDMTHTIYPKLAEYVEKLNEDEGKKLTRVQFNYKVEEKKRNLISDVYLKKHTDEAEIIKAKCPDMPFKKGSIDGNIVCLWSITAHQMSMPEMRRPELKSYLRSLVDITRSGSKIYLSPMHKIENAGKMEFIIDILEEMKNENRIKNYMNTFKDDVMIIEV